MFKLAALTATAAAASMSEIQDTVDMFKITVKQREVEGLEKKAYKLEEANRNYDLKMRQSPYIQEFQAEAQALVHTQEFVAIAKYMDQLKRQGPTPQIRKFAQIY